MNAVAPASYPQTSGNREAQLLARVRRLEADLSKASDKVAALSEENATLRSAWAHGASDFSKLRAMGFMPREAALVAGLLNNDVLTKEAARVAIYSERPGASAMVSSNVENAYMSGTRKKLSRLGVTIINIYKLGWKFSQADKTKLREMIASVK